MAWGGGRQRDIARDAPSRHWGAVPTLPMSLAHHETTSPQAPSLDEALARRGQAAALRRGEELHTAQRERAAVVLLISGVLLLEHELDNQRSGQIVAAGDLFSGPTPARVSALAATEVRMLRSLRQVTADHPEVGLALAAALLRQQSFDGQMRTVTHLPRADERVLALLDLLARRWGRVRADGVYVPVYLTHKQISTLIGGRRPTVTTAVSDLTERGRLRRTEDGFFVLPLSAAHDGGESNAEARPMGTRR